MNLNLTPWLITGVICLGLICIFQQDKISSLNNDVSAANAVIDEIKEKQQHVADIDAKYTAQLTEANNEIETLRATISVGSVGLSVNVSDCLEPTASSVGDGKTARLSKSAERAYINLRKGIIKHEKQLAACQDYINTVCLNKKSPN